MLPSDSPQAPRATVSDMTVDQLGKVIIDRISEPNNDEGPDSVFELLERSLVRHALERTKGNKQAAANLLGVYRPRLYHMIRKHELSDFT
jgi:transcriptional regulator with PAS, ATPase and Fis domain